MLEPSDRKDLTNVTRWFTTCINQPQFLKVLGKISFCEKMVPVTPKTNTAANASPPVNSADDITNGEEFPCHNSINIPLVVCVTCVLIVFVFFFRST